MFKWNGIKVLGENKMINKSYVYLFFVPALAKLLEKVNSPLNLKIFGEEFEIVFELPFTWQVFYFSALFFTIGAIIYFLRAPSIIKENKSFGDFISEKKNFSHIDEYLEDIFWDKEMYKLILWSELILNYPINERPLLPNKKFFVKHLETANIEESVISGDQLVILKHDIKYFKNFSRNKKINKLELLWVYVQHEYYKKTGGLVDLEKSFWIVYKASNRKRKWAIKLSIYSYSIGVLLIAWVIYQSTLTVIQLVF